MYVCFVRCDMKAISVYVHVCVLMSLYDCLMLKKECPQDEVHKSCSFYEEYTCWETPELNKRVKTTPKRLTHCRSGCFSKVSSDPIPKENVSLN
nr:uncharacterized protein LOC116771282 isoform X2 [Danaus plexippus plexippus]